MSLVTYLGTGRHVATILPGAASAVDHEAEPDVGLSCPVGGLAQAAAAGPVARAHRLVSAPGSRQLADVSAEVEKAPAHAVTAEARLARGEHPQAPLTPAARTDAPHVRLAGIAVRVGGSATRLPVPSVWLWVKSRLWT